MNIISWESLSFKGKIVYPDFAIEEGKTYFICGKSGSGKTSLLKLINGVNPIETGNIYYKNKEIREIDPIALRKEIMLIGQTPFLFDGSILENFKKFYELREEKLPSEEIMLQLLKLCKVKFSLDKRCEKMSGGERQRTFIAICLSFSPKVLMLDEPTSALDGKNSKELIENVKGLNKTLLIVSHDMELPKAFGDYIIWLEAKDE